MDVARRQARRYHWISDRAGSFVDEPHAAIEGQPRGAIVNLTDHQAAGARGVLPDLARDRPHTALATPSHLTLPAHPARPTSSAGSPPSAPRRRRLRSAAAASGERLADADARVN